MTKQTMWSDVKGVFVFEVEGHKRTVPVTACVCFSEGEHLKHVYEIQAVDGTLPPELLEALLSKCETPHQGGAG